MWTSGLSNDAPPHHPSLPCQPDILITPGGTLLAAYVQRTATPSPHRKREACQLPVVEGAGDGDRPGAAGQRFPFYAALVRPHAPFGRRRPTGSPAPPAPTSPSGRDEVDISALRSQRRVVAQRPAAAQHVHGF